MQYTTFSMIRDINGYNGFGLQFSMNKSSATINSSSNTTLAVPTYAKNYLAIFSYGAGANVWVSNNAAAAAPLSATFANTTSELNPSARLVSSGDTLNFFSSGATAYVGVIFYALP